MVPSLPGIATHQAALLDERARPDFREAFGALARQSTNIATAVTRVRLSTMDLSESELGGVENFRVLVAEMNAIHLTAEARSLVNDPARSSRLTFLQRMLEAGDLDLRAAPLAGWSPDFTVFSGPSGPLAVLLGPHSFERPYPHPGPALWSLHFVEAARVAGDRHSEIWEAAHDIGPAVWNILSRARGHRATGSGETADPA